MIYISITGLIKYDFLALRRWQKSVRVVKRNVENNQMIRELELEVISRHPVDFWKLTQRGFKTVEIQTQHFSRKRQPIAIYTFFQKFLSKMSHYCQSNRWELESRRQGDRGREIRYVYFGTFGPFNCTSIDFCIKTLKKIS